MAIMIYLVNKLISLKFVNLMYLRCFILSLFIIGSINAWSLVPFQQNYFNVTNITWTTNAITANIINDNSLPVSYIFINLSNYQLSLPIQEVLVTAYSGPSNTFVGNVTFYPFHNGLVAPNRSITNLPYNMLTVWFQPLGYANLTYLKDENKTIHTIKVVNNTYDNIASISLYNVTIINQSTSFYTNNFATVTTVRFNTPSIPYFLLSNIQGGTVHIKNGVFLLNPNITLIYTPQVSGFFSAKLIFNQTGLNTNITSPDTFTSTSLKSFVPINQVNSYFSDIASKNKVGFASNILLAYNNFTLKNLTKLVSTGGDFGYSSSTYQISAYAPNLTNYFGFQLQHYYIIPAYTTNFIVSANSFIPNAIQPNICNFVLSNWFCYRNRIPVNVLSWNMPPFVTNAISPASNIIFQNVPFLLLKIPHYSFLGPSCHNVLFEGNTSGFDQGNIPFGVYNCNTSTATYVLSNLTTLNDLYVNFDIYLNSQIPFNNEDPTIIGNWQRFINYPASNVVAKGQNYLISLNRPLDDRNSFIALADPPSFDNAYSAITGNMISTKTNGVANLNRGNPPSVDIDYLSDTLGQETKFVLDWGGTTCSGSGGNKCYNITGKGIFINSYANVGGGTISNMTTSIVTGKGTQTTPTNVLINLDSSGQVIVNLTRPYTQNYIIGGFESFNAGSLNISVSPQPPNIPSSNGTPLINMVNCGLQCSINGSHLNLSATKVFFGIKVNTVFILFMLILSCVLFFGAFSDNHIIMTVGLIVTWVIGITGITQFFIAIMLTVIVFMYEYEHHLKKNIGGNIK